MPTQPSARLILRGALIGAVRRAARVATFCRDNQFNATPTND
jgi:hypothetical protein